MMSLMAALLDYYYYFVFFVLRILNGCLNDEFVTTSQIRSALIDFLMGLLSLLLCLQFCHLLYKVQAVKLE